MDGPEEERIDWPLQWLQDNCLHGVLLGVFKEILDQFLVVECEPKESSDAEDYENEEEVDHDDVRNLMSEVDAEESFALIEEIEGKLLHIALVDDEEKHPIKRIFPEVFWDTIVEQCLEDQWNEEVDS